MSQEGLPIATIFGNTLDEEVAVVEVDLGRGIIAPLCSPLLVEIPEDMAIASSGSNCLASGSPAAIAAVAEKGRKCLHAQKSKYCILACNLRKGGEKIEENSERKLL